MSYCDAGTQCHQITVQCVREHFQKNPKYRNRSKLSTLYVYRNFSLLPERSQGKRSFSVSPIFDNVERCMHRLQMQLLFLIKCFFCLLSTTNLKIKAINHTQFSCFPVVTELHRYFREGNKNSTILFVPQYNF